MMKGSRRPRPRMNFQVSSAQLEYHPPLLTNVCILLCIVRPSVHVLRYPTIK